MAIRFAFAVLLCILQYSTAVCRDPFHGMDSETERMLTKEQQKNAAPDRWEKDPQLSQSTAPAADTSKNPDRYPSIGLTYSGTALHMEMDVLGEKIKQNYYNDSIKCDVRIPVSNSLTWIAAVSPSWDEQQGIQTRSVNFNVGVRRYFIGK